MPTKFVIGDRVVVPSFGTGTVTEISRTEASVRFDAPRLYRLGPIAVDLTDVHRAK